MQTAGNRSQAEQAEKVSHNISMRLKENESEFSGDATECWYEYVDNYRQISRDYRLADAQKLQFLQDDLSKDANKTYNNVVVPHSTTFQQAIDPSSLEYKSPERQSKAKNYLS